MAYAPTIQELIEGISATGAWRREKIEEYPDDKRNIDAVERLETLCKQLKEAGTSPEYEKLLAHYAAIPEADDDAFCRQTEAESEYIKGIGFRTFPEDAQAYLRGLRECAA